MKDEIRKILKAPLRAEVQTADWVTGPMSTTMLEEKVDSIALLFKQEFERITGIDYEAAAGIDTVDLTNSQQKVLNDNILDLL